jgi:hypothetical protein
VGGDNVTRRAGIIYLSKCVKYYEENCHRGWEGVILASWSEQLEGMLARVSGEDIPAKVVLPVECAPEPKIWAESATTEEYLQNFFKHFNIVEVPAGKLKKKEEQYGEPLSVIRNTCEQGWTGAGKTAEWKSSAVLAGGEEKGGTQRGVPSSGCASECEGRERGFEGGN